MRTMRSAIGAGVLGMTVAVLPARADTYTVTNTNNSGAGSFRQAVDDANSNHGADTIEFDIPGPGPHVISPTSWFPAFTSPVTIDGYSQPGAAMATETSPATIMIELDGSSAGEGVGALYFFTDSDNSRVRGLAIGGWNRIAIYFLNPQGVAIEGNYLGLHASGDAAHPNHESAVCIEQESSNYTVVGGDSPAERNVISGNYGYGIEVVGADYCTIKGNYIGTDASGTTHIHNSTGGIDVGGDHNSIMDNLISGNEGPGIILEYFATHSTVTGNRIGTDVSGTVALPNSGHGIECECEYSSIGGSGEGEGNLISGNQQQGINVSGSSYNTFQGNYMGTDVTGTHAIANAWSGICLSESSDHNVIGGAAEGEGNLISGNAIYGVDIQSSRDITVEGNLIGTDATGLAALGNGYSGISVSHSAYDNTIGGDVGAGNTIAHNGYTGITLTAHNGNAVLANSIFSNPELGIDLNGDGRTPNDPDDPDTGPNRLQNFPVLTALKVTPAGDLKAAYNVPSAPANSTYPIRVEFFTSAGGQGKEYVGFADYSTPAGTVKTMFSPAAPVNPGDPIVATATDAAGNTSEFSAAAVSPTGCMIHSGDYTGDGVSEIAVFRPASGLWAIRGVSRVYFGMEGDLPVSGDYNGDGTTDIGIYRPSSCLWAIRGMSRVGFGTSGDVPAPGDYNGDGTADMAVFQAGLWKIRGVSRVFFGAEGDRPVPGDYRGDGRREIAVFRPASGLWAVKDSTRVYYGKQSDWPAPADYSGDGTWDIAVFRPSSGLWNVRGGNRAYFGKTVDWPQPADYTGDGTADLGLFREDTARWAVRGLTRTYFGKPEDIPIAR